MLANDLVTPCTARAVAFACRLHSIGNGLAPYPTSFALRNANCVSGFEKDVYGALKRMKGYGLDPAQMQLQGGRHLLMELKAAGWRRVWAIIKGARPEILDGLVKRILVEEAKYGCIE